MSRNLRYGGTALALVGLAVVVFLAPSLLNAYLMYLLTWIAVYAIAGTGLTVLMGWTGQVALAHAGFFGVGAYGIGAGIYFLSKNGQQTVCDDGTNLCHYHTAVQGSLSGRQ